MFQAIVSCQFRLGYTEHFGWDIGDALAQQQVCFYLSIFIGHRGSALLNSFQALVQVGRLLWSLSHHLDFWRSPIGNVTEEDQ